MVPTEISPLDSIGPMGLVWKDTYMNFPCMYTMCIYIYTLYIYIYIYVQTTLHAQSPSRSLHFTHFIPGTSLAHLHDTIAPSLGKQTLPVAQFLRWSDWKIPHLVRWLSHFNAHLPGLRSDDAVSTSDKELWEKSQHQAWAREKSWVIFKDEVRRWSMMQPWISM